MHDLPDDPLLDKHMLVGACIRLPIRIDAEQLAKEVAAIRPEAWEVRGGRGRYPQQGAHRAADTVFLRGFAPAEGNLPIEDRQALDQLPYVRRLIEHELGSRPQRCLLARLPGGASVVPHVDRAPYFSKTLRVHVPVETNAQVWMVCAGAAYRMQPGEAWGLNNVAVHGVWNAHATHARTHLICDFLPDATLLELHARGERDLGRRLPEVDAHFAGLGTASPAMGG